MASAPAHPRITEHLAHTDEHDRWSFTRIAAPSTLTGLIDGYCDYDECTQSFHTRRELPHAEGVLILNLGAPIRITGGDGRLITLAGGEGFVAGAHLRPALSQGGGSQRGVQIALPLTTLRRLLGLPMSGLQDRVVDLRTLCGSAVRPTLERLLEAPTLDTRITLLDQWLGQVLTVAPVLDARTLAALQLIRRAPGLDLSAIAGRVGWSRKHFAERVQDAVGVGPRSFRRLLRFQALQALLRAHAATTPDWADLAAQAGYCDQSHLCREFQEFAALTPGGYWQRLRADGGGLVEA